MPTKFLCDDFLLQTESARRLYHDYAAAMPIYDYHCHIPPAEIAEDKQWDNLTQIWLYGDHYKWRAMRANGVEERYCTGDASDYEKFEKWAATVPKTLRNPLYHWTHLELQRYFGIDELLDPRTARSIYDRCGEMLRSPEFSARNLMRKMNVAVVCTTDEPLDDLKYHEQIRDDGFEIKVYPAWRPDAAMAADDLPALNAWVAKLAAATDTNITDFMSCIGALKKRHDFFHEAGCRLSDHGVETAYSRHCTVPEANTIFQKVLRQTALDADELLKLKSSMLHKMALMDHSRGWVQQFHFGALRDTNTRMLKALGPNTGFDCIGDFEMARPLAKFLDCLDTGGGLTKTILYNLNPRDNELMATMIGNFQDGSAPGKMQWGSAWWFLDQIDGMTKQIEALSNMGLLSRFVGMLTDSRSFLSYPRHEYFRRVLCNILGGEMENGLLPSDMKLLGEMVENISYNNAVEYFPMAV